MVPVPTVPDLGSLPANQATQLFRHLGSATEPQVVDISGRLLLLAAGALAASILLALFDLAVMDIPNFAGSQRKRWQIAGACFLVGVLGLCSPLGLTMRSAASLEVLRAEQVGAYDVRVVRSTHSDTLVTSLEENGFGFSDEDTRSFDDYINRNGYFVVALSRQIPDADLRLIREVASLALRFKSSAAVYRMALPGTSGSSTLVELYVFSAGRMENDADLPLRYAGPFRNQN
ncbi:MAG: DUF2330 domain-containing protein [Candidatus Latescibacterota bacterium]|nr:MAG: DUF2330 domain-containing protein [Candidatus Latescibacterota bacterium]